MALSCCRGDSAGDLPAPGPGGRWDAHRLEPFGADEVLARAGDTTTVVALWATWCAPCVEEMPELEAFSRAHPGITVIGLNTDAAGNEDEVQAVLDRVRPSYPQARLAGGEGRLFDRLGLDWDGVLPKTIVLAARPDRAQPPPRPRVLPPPVTRASLETALAPQLEE